MLITPEKNTDSKTTIPDISDMDLLSFYDNNDSLDESAASEKLKEASKRLPKWSLSPPAAYKEKG